MTAEPREELLSAYLDDELSASERAQVEQWLAESAEYRQLYEELRAVRHDLESLPRHKLAEDLGPAVLRRAERTVLAGRATPPVGGEVKPGSTLAQWWSRGSSRRMFIWPAVAVAAALMVALFDARQDGQREIARKADEAPPASELRANGREGARFGKTDSARGAAAEESPPLSSASKSNAERDDAGRAAKSAAKTDFDSPNGAVRKELQMRDAPAEVSAGVRLLPQNAPAAAAPGQQAANSVKLESNVRQALANREQVNFIQADVSPDFVAENQMEKVLTDNKVKFQRYALGLAVDEKDYRARVQTKDKQQQPELSYTLQASPEQVEGIVTQLEREQSRRRVSNLAVGLQQNAAAKVGGAGGKVEQTKPADASYFKKQQPVTIYLFWQQNAAKAAEPAKP